MLDAGSMGRNGNVGRLLFSADHHDDCHPCVIPVALKLLHWPWVKKQITGDGRQGQKAYLRWSMLRCGVLGVCLLLNLVIYYNVLEKSNALCALILLLAYFFCWPSAVKMKAETECVE